MEEAEECAPVTVEGVWNPAQTKTVKNKLQLYFQSKKKSGGGECRVEAEDGAPRAAVYFRLEEVRERVLARKNHEITVDNQAVQLRLSSAPSPTNEADVSDSATDSKTAESEVESGDGASAEKQDESIQSFSVVLDNVESSMSRDLLLLLVESISGLDDSFYSLEIIVESNRAVVTFNSPADVEKFLTVSQTSQKLQKYKLTVWKLEEAKSIRLESLPPTVIEDLLELYFEKNWAQPENITMIPDEEAAIVTFVDPKVVKTICIKRDYSIGSTPVKVYPYYESLGTALYGKERPTWKMPEPFTEGVHHVIWKFLQIKKLSNSISDQMRPYFCYVNMEKPEVELSPIPTFLRQKGLTAQQVDLWKTTAQDAFRLHMSQYTAFECTTNGPAWKAAEKEVRSVVREDAHLDLDASRGVLTVAGKADNVKTFRPSVENIVSKALSQIERQTNGVSEVMNLSPAIFYILQQEGLQKATQDISPEMNLSYDQSSQKLTITGLPAEVSKTKAWILERNSPKNEADVSDSKTAESEVQSGDGASAEKQDESIQSFSVVLDNVESSMSRDLLLMLVESISGLDDSFYTLEIIVESNRAVVTFNSPADVEKFLTVSQTSQKLQKYKLTVWKLEETKSVRLESLPPTVIEDLLELYFEKNWAQPKNITMIPDEEAAIVTFVDPKVVKNISIKRDYSIGSTPVKVYPYYESLGTALYGKERPTWKMPEPFTEGVHHVIWKFLQIKKLSNSISDQMRPYFCNVNMEKPEVELSPIPTFLRQKGLTAQQVDLWKTTAQDAFRLHMSQYTAFECTTNGPAWKAAEKEVRSVVREDAHLDLDESRGVLTVAGKADNVKTFRPSVENIVSKALSQIEQQTNGVSEVMNLSPAIFYILKQEGLQKATQDISPEMNLSYDQSSQKLTITGLPAEVSKTKAWILERNSPKNEADVSDSKTAESEVQSGDGASAEKQDESIQSFSVVLDNVESSMSRDLLLMLVESISGLDDSFYTLEIIVESNRAVVTFNSPADVEKFLTVSQTSQKLQKYKLTVWKLEETKSVRLESLPPTVIEDLLELYFEKNWAQPENITMIPDEEAAIVTFVDPKVVKNICIKRDYSIGSTPVKVYPYYESLGTALYGKERPTWKMPEPFTEGVHHVIWKFLQIKKLSNSISDQMRPYFCYVNMEKPEVELSPIPTFLRQKGLTAQQVDLWKTTAQDAFRLHMSQYTAFECTTNGPAWKAAEKEVRSVVREDAHLDLDASRGVLTVAGKADNLKTFRPSVENIVSKALCQIERQTNGVSEVMNWSPAIFYILKQEGLQKATQDISLEMNLSYDQSSQKLTIRGLPAEVSKTKAWILERNVNRSKKQIELHPGLLDFLKTVDPMDMSQHLFTSQGVSAIFSVENKGVLLLGSSEGALAGAESKLKESLTVMILDVEDQAVLNLPDWVDLNRKLLDSYNSSKKKTVSIQIYPGRQDQITVAGFMNPVKEVSRNLLKFIDCYSRVEERIRLKSAVVEFIDKKNPQELSNIGKDNGVKVNLDALRQRINITGARLHVEKAKSCLKELTGSLFSDNLRMNKPGAKKFFQSQEAWFQSIIMSEFSCVVILRPENQEEEEEENNEDENGFSYLKVKTAGGVLVSVSKADICQFGVWRSVDLFLETEEFEPTEFEFCADNEKALSQAKKRIEKLILEEQASKTIQDQYISQLSQEDMEKLKDLQRNLTVSIRLDNGQEDEEPKIHLEGLTRDVSNVESTIREIIQRVERQENLKRQATLMSSLVEWQFQHPNGNNVPFDIFTNLKLEEALNKKESVKIKINNENFKADVEFRTAVSANGHKRVELLRKDLKSSAPLPSNWEDMKGALLKLFALTPGTTEYKDVETELTKTGLTANIISIERVQNPTLWQTYELKKNHMEKKNKHTNNERQLFHGTGADSIDLINQHGFNRSYAGRHAAMYGNGTYFAVDPCYSAQGYAKPDSSGHKRMYLARVLVGDFTQGRSGMLVPPAKNTGNASDLYDSLTDNNSPPSMFIVFNDAHAYPEYLITFT